MSCMVVQRTLEKKNRTPSNKNNKIHQSQKGQGSLKLTNVTYAEAGMTVSIR